MTGGLNVWLLGAVRNGAEDVTGVHGQALSISLI